ncbi:hypothetical protein ACFQT0_31055 [Hymenobacter humi]|uniref:Lipocalin-like domain-containing protein n=1 Tax=Hymenobacter humi TaxID=1411620 RepID=A0ABW2UEV0_9BACT
MKKLLPLLLFYASLTACQKDKDPAAPTKTDLLTATNWRLAAYTVVSVTAGSSTTVDAYAAYPACQRDNFIRFRPDKSILYDEGPAKCDPAISQTETSSWQWADNEQTLAVASRVVNASIPYEVVELTNSTLRLRYTRKQYFGGSDLSTDEWTYHAF